MVCVRKRNLRDYPGMRALPGVVGPGGQSSLFTDHKNIGEYMTTMLASGRVSGKVHRWMASLGEGFVRGIKELRYIRGEENWIADALSRSLQQEKSEGTVDPSVKACLDFFFSEESRVKYRRGKKCDDFDGGGEDIM